MYSAGGRRSTDKSVIIVVLIIVDGCVQFQPFEQLCAQVCAQNETLVAGVGHATTLFVVVARHIVGKSLGSTLNGHIMTGDASILQDVVHPICRLRIRYLVGSVGITVSSVIFIWTIGLHLMVVEILLFFEDIGIGHVVLRIELLEIFIIVYRRETSFVADPHFAFLSLFCRDEDDTIGCIDTIDSGTGVFQHFNALDILWVDAG